MPRLSEARARAPNRFDVDAIAFDLDNTLIDILRLKRKAARAAARVLVANGLPLRASAVEAGIVRAAFEAGLDSDEIVARYLASGSADPSALEPAATAAFAAIDASGARAYPGARKALAALTRAGYRLAVVTDAPRRAAERRLASARLASFFELVVAREDTANGKADAAPFALAASRLGVPPDRILAVGDNPARDVGTAKRAGMFAVLATHGLTLEFARLRPGNEPDGEIACLADLPGLLLPPRAKGVETAIAGPAPRLLPGGATEAPIAIGDRASGNERDAPLRRVEA